MKTPADRADLWSCGKFAFKNTGDVQPVFNNLKEEVLNNSFHSITQRQWNYIFLKTNDIYNCQVGSKERLKFSRILKANKIKFKHILAIKLYTDDIELQRAFKKCFYASDDVNIKLDPKIQQQPCQVPGPSSNVKVDQQRLQRCREFYHWYLEIAAAINALSKIKCMLRVPKLGLSPEIYRGVKCHDVINRGLVRKKTTFDGPMSCTTSKHIAREFAGEYGVVLVIQPHGAPVDLSLISGYSHEKEVLLFGQEITVKEVIKSPRNQEPTLQQAL